MAIYTGLALFAGGAGLELGLSLALGTDYKTVAYVERECTSAAVLVANMERGWLDKAPVWDDVTTFTGDAVSPLVDQIDIISAGFPCQPWSVAGSRKGTDDERWLWPLIFRLVREIRPRSIFLENVPGLLHGGIEHVLGDLASVGFDAEWTSVRASDVGAPHRRERVFILANSKSERPREAGRHIERPTPRTASDRTALENPNDRLGIAENSSLQTGRIATGNASSGELGYTGSERLEGSHDHRESPGGLQPRTPERCGNVDDSCGDECERQVQEHTEGFVSPVESGSSVVNASSERRWAQGDSEQQPVGIDWGSRPLYWPPGPASPEWGEITDQRPDLAPAIAQQPDRSDYEYFIESYRAAEPCPDGDGRWHIDSSCVSEDYWAVIEAKFAEAESEVRGVADGLAGGSSKFDSVVQTINECECNCHETSNVTQASGESISSIDGMREVRREQPASEASRGLAESVGDSGSLPAMPHEQAHGDRDMGGRRGRVSGHEDGVTFCETCQLPSLQRGIPTEKDATRAALRKAGVLTSTGEVVSPEKMGLARSDKLRILGNGVVPQQAALAYTILNERLQKETSQ